MGTFEQLTCYHPSCESPKDNKKNGQCIYCYKLYHFACIGVRPSTTIVCKTCRDNLMPPKRQQAGENVDVNKLNEEIAKLREECENLKKENNELKSKLKNKPTENHLIMCDSTLRDVDQGKLEDTKLVCIRGANVKSLKKELGKFHGMSFQSVTHVVGTNDLHDIKDDPTKIPEVIEEYKSLMNETKAISEQVLVSSVCPRLDEVKPLVEPFNVALRDACEEQNNDFIDSTNIFTLSNGDVNDGYLWGRGPHITKPATNKLIRNLKVRVKDGINDVTRSKPSDDRGTTTYAAVVRNHDSHSHSDRQNRRVWDRSNDRTQNRNQSTDDDIMINRNGCRFCNEPGHNMNTCRHSGPVTCRKCHARGHKDKHHRSFRR